MDHKGSEKDDDEIEAWIDDKKKESASKKTRLVTAVEIDPMKKLNNLTQLNNLQHLQHLHPISEHLWWLALMVKITLAIMVVSFLISLLVFS